MVITSFDRVHLLTVFYYCRLTFVLVSPHHVEKKDGAYTAVKHASCEEELSFKNF